MFGFYSNNNYTRADTLSVTSGSLTSSYLYDRDKTTKWVSVGYNNDSWAPYMLIAPPSITTEPFSVQLFNHNFKEFQVSMVKQDNSSVVTYVENNVFSNTCVVFPSATSSSLKYIVVNPVATMVPNAEKFMAELVISKRLIELPSIDAKDFVQNDQHVGFTRTLSDGGTVNIRVSSKYVARLGFTMVPTSTVAELFSIWSANSTFQFIPFGLTPGTTTTPTRLSSEIHEVCWTGPFSFYNFSSNNMAAGYNGSISLNQVPDQ